MRTSALLALLLALLYPAASHADLCPQAPRANVTVTTHQDPARLNTSVDIRGLQSIKGGSDIASGGQQHVPLGLARAEVTYQVGIQARVAQLRNGNYCVSLSDVKVDYDFENTTIYIANELPPGTCAYSQVAAHEQRHVATDAQLLNEWQFRLRQDAEYAVRNIDTVVSRDQQAAVNQLKAELATRIKASANSLLQERARRQAQVDSKMEYDRVSRSCNGQVQEFVRKALGY